LRQRARQTLATLSLEAKNEQSQNICNILEQYIDQYDTRAVYVPFSYEPNIDFFVQKLRDHKKIVVLPQIQDGIMELAIYRPNSIITK
jgi:5-formyltetrahydrofolate cyclo-ligase